MVVADEDDGFFVDIYAKFAKHSAVAEGADAFKLVHGVFDEVEGGGHGVSITYGSDKV